MAEIIDLQEIQAARRRSAARASERESLERAIQIMRENLAAAANHLTIAPHAEQDELLRRILRLASMIRYGMRMLGETSDPGLDPASAGS